MAKTYTKKEIERMRDEIFENVMGAGIDDGADEDEAQDGARDYAISLTDEEVIKEYKEMTE